MSRPSSVKSYELDAPPTATKPTATTLNVLTVILGERIIKPSYPSLYREEFVRGKVVQRLYVCPRCFRYTEVEVHYIAHRRFCDVQAFIPGRVIYTSGEHQIYEVDAEEHQLFAQNLSLFTKLFIETKSVCFDVNSFLFYLLVVTTADANKPQIVGFFSKEKLSWDNNNLACILTFPPWQRRGYGQLLMGASYEISRREGKPGGPEKPLSSLGKQSYLAYWSRAIARCVLSLPLNRTIAIQDVSETTAILPEDITGTLLHMGILGSKRKDGSVVLSKESVREWVQTYKVDIKPPVESDNFIETEDDNESSVSEG